MRSHLQILPAQPPKWLSYLRSGRLLYSSLILFMAESLIYWYFLQQSYMREDWYWFIFWLAFFGFSFLHIFLVMADGWSRYQNYKRVKDQLFLYGFDTRIISQYMGSACQRIAALTAAEELLLKQDVANFFYAQGYRWYHWIPDFMIRDPLFLIRASFWSRTFLEKYYETRIDFYAVSLEQRPLM